MIDECLERGTTTKVSNELAESTEMRVSNEPKVVSMDPIEPAAVPVIVDRKLPPTKPSLQEIFQPGESFFDYLFSFWLNLLRKKLQDIPSTNLQSLMRMIAKNQQMARLWKLLQSHNLTPFDSSRKRDLHAMLLLSIP
jgi:hypothetical protein